MATRQQIEPNERLFREVNERSNELSEQLHGGRDDLVDFFCECGRDFCVERLRMTLPEYEAVRREPNRFAVVPGHEIEPLETVAHRRERFVVVEKEWLEE